MFVNIPFPSIFNDKAHQNIFLVLPCLVSIGLFWCFIGFLLAGFIVIVLCNVFIGYKNIIIGYIWWLIMFSICSPEHLFERSIVCLWFMTCNCIYRIHLVFINDKLWFNGVMLKWESSFIIWGEKRISLQMIFSNYSITSYSPKDSKLLLRVQDTFLKYIFCIWDHLEYVLIH